MAVHVPIHWPIQDILGFNGTIEYSKRSPLLLLLAMLNCWPPQLSRSHHDTEVTNSGSVRAPMLPPEPSIKSVTAAHHSRAFGAQHRRQLTIADSDIVPANEEINRWQQWREQQRQPIRHPRVVVRQMTACHLDVIHDPTYYAALWLFKFYDIVTNQRPDSTIDSVLSMSKRGGEKQTSTVWYGFGETRDWK